MSPSVKSGPSSTPGITFKLQSLLLDELNRKDKAQTNCDITELDLARSLPQFASGPQKSYLDKNGQQIWAPSLDSWLGGYYQQKHTKACQDLTEIRKSIDSVHAVATRECASRAMETVPKYILAYNASSWTNSLRADGVSVSGQTFDPNYHQGKNGKYKREGVTQSTYEQRRDELAASHAKNLVDAGKYVTAMTTVLRNIERFKFERGGVGIDTSTKTEIGMDSTLGKMATFEVTHIMNQNLTKVGLVPSISCENGYCQSGGKYYLDDLWKGKRDWSKTDAAKGPGLAEPTEKISTIEYVRPKCMANGERTCTTPIPVDEQKDPLQECVTKEVHAYYDTLGRMEISPNVTYDSVADTPMTLRAAGICDPSFEGKALCENTNSSTGMSSPISGCDAKSEGANFCRQLKLASYTNYAWDVNEERTSEKAKAEADYLQHKDCDPRFIEASICQKFKNERVSTFATDVLNDKGQVLDGLKNQLAESKRLNAQVRCSMLNENFKHLKNVDASASGMTGDQYFAQFEKFSDLSSVMKCADEAEKQKIKKIDLTKGAGFAGLPCTSIAQYSKPGSNCILKLPEHTSAPTVRGP